MQVKLIECPRDAMQGWAHQIPTEMKVAYINQLLKVGFDTIDFGSFVSPKAIPQMADTKDVLPQLNLEDTQSKLLAIVANKRGADDAVAFEQINYLGFPFSISETFQQKNTNSTIAESLLRVDQIQNLCVQKNKELVVYISMGFGNPYGDPYNAEVAMEWVEKLSELGVSIFAMSDTVGVSNPENIQYIFSELTKEFTGKGIEFGAHFHSTAETREEKLKAAIESGCFRFDSAIKGIGGCPMAQNDLVGNMATEDLISFLENQQIEHGLNKEAFAASLSLAAKVFI
jgi:hydroxymethylglutaryl-CoA lyase